MVVYEKPRGGNVLIDEVVHETMKDGAKPRKTRSASGAKGEPLNVSKEEGASGP
jgi:hypothetical protein